MDCAQQVWNNARLPERDQILIDADIHFPGVSSTNFEDLRIFFQDRIADAITRRRSTPRPLANLTAQDLNAIREIVLAVIEDGDPDSARWWLYEDSGGYDLWDSADVQQERLLFAAEIERRLISAGKGER